MSKWTNRRFDWTIIKGRRVLLKLSQEELAEAAGLDRFQLLRIEGGRQNPTPNQLVSLAAALGRTPNYFYREA